MSPRILLVDDEANIRRMVGALLQGEGFETDEAANGTLALTVAREMQQSGARYAAVSLCIGVGQGLAVILERGE